MGLGRGLAALTAALGPLGAGAPAQEPHPLALRAAELREPDAGTMAELEDTVRGLARLVGEDPARAGEIVWEETLGDLYAGALARGNGESWCTFVAWQLALAWRTSGDVERARSLLERRLGGLGDGDPYAPFVRIELADFARFAGRWPEARAHLERAREALVPPGADPFAHEPAEREAAVALATWFDVAGQFYHELGRSELAARHYAEALERAIALDDDALWWAAIDDQVRLAFATGRLQEVEDLWARVREHALWARGSEADRAKLDFPRARALVELEWRGERARGTARAMLLRVVADERTYEHDALDAEILLATAALDAGELDEARAWIEAALARRSRSGAGAEGTSPERFALEALGWRLARAGANAAGARAALDGGRAVFERFLASWAATPLLPGGVGFLQSDWRNQLLCEWLALELDVLGEVDGARAAAEDLLRAQACGTLTRALAAPAVGLAEVRSGLLAGGRGALSWVPGREAGLVLAIDEHAVRAFALAPLHEQQRARAALEEAALLALSAGDARRLAAAVERATSAFLPGGVWRAIAGWSEIVVVGAEGAGLLGFEALEPERGRPLGHVRAVSHVPSLQVGVALARAADTGRAGIALVAPAGSAASGPELPPLPFDRDHAERLCALHGRGHSLVLEGAAATGAALRSPAFPAVLAATFVTHGLFDPARERPAGLLLAGGEELWSEDVEQLSSPPLVTLIACGAGRGPLRRGDDGRAHLGAAFLRAGARTVVLGQADLEYRFAHALDTAFHERLAAGDAPAEALRAARVSAGAETGSAPLQGLLVRLYGLGSRPCFPPADGAGGAGARPWILGALLALLMLALLLARPRRRA